MVPATHSRVNGRSTNNRRQRRHRLKARKPPDLTNLSKSLITENGGLVKRACTPHDNNGRDSSTTKTSGHTIHLRFEDRPATADYDAHDLDQVKLADIAEQATSGPLKSKTATLVAEGLADWPIDAQASYWNLWKALHEGRGMRLVVGDGTHNEPIEVAEAMLLGADATAKKFKERLHSAAEVVRLTSAAGDHAAHVERLVQRLRDLGAKTDQKDKLLRLVNKGLGKAMHGGGQAGEEGGCIVSYWFDQYGRHARPLTNFTARILHRIFEDDESGQTKPRYEIKVRGTDGVEETIEVPADDFDSLGWLKKLVRVFAFIESGQGTASQVRATICRLSGKPPIRQVYTHTGWRKHKQWVFLHAGGAIGKDGPVKGVRVRLDESLADYDLLRMPKRSEWDGKIVTDKQLRTAIRASLDILKVAPYRLTVPLLGATFRAVLGNANFSGFCFGHTGKLKTSFCALAQQHFGYKLHHENIPFGADSTSNAIQELLYLAKDVIAVVDDYVEAGTPADIQRMRREMGRTVRAKGNRQGRTRLKSDSTIRKGRAPRALPIYTGEQHATVQSVLARAFNLEFREGDIRVDRLSRCQAHGAAGLFTQTMAAFIKDVASRYDAVMEQVAQMRTEYRDKVQKSSQHKRISMVIADVYVGFKMFLKFAEKKGAITSKQRVAYTKKAWSALSDLINDQNKLQVASNPADRLIELLRAAVQSGRAYVVDLKGKCPDPYLAAAYGWRKNDKALAPGYGAHKIGWIDGQSLYLYPREALKAAEDMLSKTEDQLGLSTDDMGTHLLNRKYLRSDGLKTSQCRIQIRRTVEDKQNLAVYDVKQSAIIAADRSATVPERSEDDDDEQDGADEPAPAQKSRKKPSRKK